MKPNRIQLQPGLSVRKFLEEYGTEALCEQALQKRIKYKIMQCMADREADRKLGGLVEIDDAYLGGERNGGKVGRGSENKVPFVIAVSSTDDGRPRHAVLTSLKGFTKTALLQWAERHLAPEAGVFSDGLGAVRAVIDQGHAHTVIATAGRLASCQTPGSRWVNTVLSNVKRAIDGRYHAFKFAKYAQRYLAEAAWRFNRRFDLATLVPKLIEHLVLFRPLTEAAQRVPVAAY